MTRNTKAQAALSQQELDALREMGARIRYARKRRGQTLSSLAQRMLVTPKTLRRLEQGDPGVSLGLLVSALYCLGLDHDLASVAAPATDEIGQRHDSDRLARIKRVRPPRENLDF